MQIDTEIGYAKANNSICSLNYYFSSCEYVSNSITYNDNEFCRLFKIDQSTGMKTVNIFNIRKFMRHPHVSNLTNKKELFMILIKFLLCLGAHHIKH